ncbi:hypothetical protein [Caballeronia hypogeia]|uniref:hypothetical protein n=1 Tax=Caballeronia hypogeia TaxID=1777140 RepID=UPI000AE192B2|nr:hypothetical protein [Caballeronia hypogeia]
MFGQPPEIAATRLNASQVLRAKSFVSIELLDGFFDIAAGLEMIQSGAPGVCHRPPALDGMNPLQRAAQCAHHHPESDDIRPRGRCLIDHLVRPRKEWYACQREIMKLNK